MIRTFFFFCSILAFVCPPKKIKSASNDFWLEQIPLFFILEKILMQLSSSHFLLLSDCTCLSRITRNLFVFFFFGQNIFPRPWAYHCIEPWFQWVWFWRKKTGARVWLMAFIIARAFDQVPPMQIAFIRYSTFAIYFHVFLPHCFYGP